MPKKTLAETLKERPATFSFFFCADGRPHDLVYQGSALSAYRCRGCAQIMTKVELKENTEVI